MLTLNKNNLKKSCFNLIAKKDNTTFIFQPHRSWKQFQHLIKKSWTTILESFGEYYLWRSETKMAANCLTVCQMVINHYQTCYNIIQVTVLQKICHFFSWHILKVSIAFHHMLFIGNLHHTECCHIWNDNIDTWSL